ncbi:unnamed protein product, partial [Staurois parvus]
LNTFSHQQSEQSCDFYQCPAELVGVFILPYEAAGPLTLCLNSADWPCADNMYAPSQEKKKTKKTF